MSWTTSAHPSASAKLAILFLIAYPFFVWILAANRREGSGPMSASAVPATLTPIFVAMAASWLGIARVVWGMSRYGGGRSATAAGIAEILGLMLFGGMIAAIVASSSWIRDRMARDEAPRHPASKRTIIASLALVAVCIAILFVQAFVAHAIVDTQSRLWLAMPVTAAAVSGAGAVASLIWLIASRRLFSMQLDPARGRIAASCAVAAWLLCYASWRFAHVFMAIALHG